MLKLKNKVFWTLFIILSLFLISILLISNYQSYQREVENIRTNLNRMNTVFKKEEQKRVPLVEDNADIEKELENDLEHKVFIDSIVYTVLLSENNEITSIIGHNEEDTNTDEIFEVSNQIIANSTVSRMQIGNLYLDKYSYAFQNRKSLIIIDHSLIKTRLYSELFYLIMIFIVLEGVIIFVSKKLTGWMIQPVVDSFDKQKQFIADASHELKTPLSVIIASADALAEDGSEKKWLYNIKQEAERMNHLISNLLSLAKMENEPYKLSYSLHNLSKIVEMSILTFESLMYEKKINLNYEIEKNIHMNCDSNTMKQLLAILLDNAIRHSSKNGKIVVKLQKKKEEIVLEVINKGDPIPTGKEEKIFERFYRGDESRNRNDNRYGLGLAIAKSIVLNHDGRITAQSLDGFTTFRVVFR